MVLPTDFTFARYFQNEDSYILLDGLDSDFRWIRDDNTFIVVVPRKCFAGGDRSVLPPPAVSMLDTMLVAGKYEDILSVMALQEAVVDALAVTPSELPLEVLQLAYSTIRQFAGCINFDEEYVSGYQSTLSSLRSLIGKVGWQ